MTQVFSVQDETGTVAQLSILPSPALVISVGDSGVYTGVPDDGTDLINGAPDSSVAVPFVVGQVLDASHFSVTTNNANLSDWPALGVVQWMTGVNAGSMSNVTEIDGANAYITEAFFYKYHTSRGNAVPAGVTDLQVQNAIVQATDYLDQKYRFNGTKLLQNANTAGLYLNSTFLDAWTYSYLTPYAMNDYASLIPVTTTQSTEWPRQGVVDYNGDTIYGIPKQVQAACAELAIRVLNGVVLQPDYDPNLVGNGGIVQSIDTKIGPLDKRITYDTKLGIGFFASFPIVDRMLSKGGLLMAGGGRTVIR